MRGIRGAICARENSREEIHAATRHLLAEIVKRNELAANEVVAVFFTMTPDLDADFPAHAARDTGWTSVPMLGAQESQVPGSPERVIRVLVLAQGRTPARHVYLGRAAAMRPDLAEPGDAEAWDGQRDEPLTRCDDGSRLGRALVIGLGLIGGSIGAAARAAGLFSSVVGYDRDAERASSAVRLGLVDSAGEDLYEELAHADTVVLATPVSEITALLQRLGPRFREGAVVTDVGSTKREIVAAMARLPERVRAVGGHPMAGGTASGPSAARADLFRGTTWILVETPRTDETAVRVVERLVRCAGARPLRMEAEVHDRAVAATSHLPAVAAVALTELVARRGVGSGAAMPVGPGFVSATRLAAGDPAMTAQMLAANADNLGGAVDEFIQALAQLRLAVAGDPAALVGRLRDAGALRASLLGRPAG